jgi:hypothetical protein
MSLAERASAMAAKARAKAAQPYPDRLAVAREWWRITLPGGDSFDLYVCPPQHADWVRAQYPGCGVSERAAIQSEAA